MDSLQSHQGLWPVRTLGAGREGRDPSVSVAPRLSVDFEGAVGQLEGSDDEVLGKLVDGAVTADGKVAILDASYGVVRLFTRDLKPRGRLGGFGGGAGEVADPLGLFRAGPGWVGVVDGAGRRIEYFPLAPSSSSARPGIRIGVSRVFDTCQISDRLFALGLVLADTQGLNELTNVALVHELNATGAVKSSFSEPYPPIRHPLVADIYAIGRLACDHVGGGRIYAAYSMLGEVHAMSSDGDLVWIAQLSDFQQPRQRHVAGRSIGVDPEQDILRIDYIEHLALLSPQVLALTVRSRVRESLRSSSWNVVHVTYLIDAVSGELVEHLQGDVMVIGGGNGHAILYREVPHPQVVVREFVH